MKFISQLATVTTIMVLAGSGIAAFCGSSETTRLSDLNGLRNDLANNGQNYRVSGRGNSQFDQVGTARLKLRRTNGIPTGSTHVQANIVANVVQSIIDQCCSGAFCCGNENTRGDQGDAIDVNIPCN